MPTDMTRRCLMTKNRRQGWLLGRKSSIDNVVRQFMLIIVVSVTILLQPQCHPIISVVTAQSSMTDMENIIEFDVTETSAVQFQCTDLTPGLETPFNPRCEFRMTTDCESWTCTGSTNQMTYCDSEFFVPGRESDSYRLMNCAEGSSARCDGSCTCATGVFNTDTMMFEPDGNSCRVIDEDPGTLDPFSSIPSDTPSLSPSMSENGSSPPSPLPGPVGPPTMTLTPTMSPSTEVLPPSGGNNRLHIATASTTVIFVLMIPAVVVGLLP